MLGEGDRYSSFGSSALSAVQVEAWLQLARAGHADDLKNVLPRAVSGGVLSIV